MPHSGSRFRVYGVGPLGVYVQMMGVGLRVHLWGLEVPGCTLERKAS